MAICHLTLPIFKIDGAIFRLWLTHIGNTESAVGSTKQRLFFRPHLVDENIRWRDILETGERFELAPDEVYVPANRELVLVLDGVVQFYCTAHTGRERLVYNVGRNSFANAGATATGSNRFLHLLARRKATLVKFDAYAIYDYDFIAKYPHLMVDLTQSMAKTTVLFSFRAYNMYFHECTSRVCKVLLDLTEEENSPRFQHMDTMTQNDIADFAGTHHVTVSRVLKKLREDGVLGEVTPSYVDVYDMARLRRLEELEG